VGNNGKQPWIWLALDVETREIVGVSVGDRRCQGAQGVWDALPAVSRQCAVAYTDFWSAYDEIFPSQRHQSVGKDSGKNSYIERFNCTLRQRVSRLVRKTLSFSKKLESQIAPMWLFVHHSNASLPV
jgi:IS1 family transposase